MSNKAIIIAINRGKRGLITRSILVLAIPIPTKRTEPTGGVHNPIQRLSTIMIPNCIGSIPKDLTTGRKIGVKINTAGVISINIPTKSSNKLMMMRMKTLLSLMLNNTSLRFWGIFS